MKGRGNVRAPGLGTGPRANAAGLIGVFLDEAMRWIKVWQGDERPRANEIVAGKIFRRNQAITVMMEDPSGTWECEYLLSEDGLPVLKAIRQPCFS